MVAAEHDPAVTRGIYVLERGTLTALRHGAGLSALELSQAFAVQNTVTRAWGAFLDDFDLLLTPTLPVPALPVGSLDQDAESIQSPATGSTMCSARSRLRRSST